MRRRLSKTFRCKLVEFDTDLGLRYAVPPTFWVRIYLVWTFRNFRSLPKQVFNRHQQKLIEQLIQSSSSARETRVDRNSLIGTVEQVRLKSSGVVAHPSPQLIAAGSTSQHTPSEPSDVQSTERPQWPSIVPTRREWKFPAHKEVASLLLLATAMLITLLFFRHGVHILIRSDHVKASATTVPASMSDQAQIQNIALPVSPLRASAAVSHSRDEIAGLAVRQLPHASMPSASLQSLTAASVNPSSKKQGQVSLAAMATPAVERAPEPTMSLKPDTADDSNLPHLIEPPQSRMIYPTYPETQQNGKVVLTAVVDPDGTVKSVTVITGKKIFARAALKAVRQWRYLPYQLQGKPVQFQTTIAFDFRGDEVISVSFPQL